MDVIYFNVILRKTQMDTDNTIMENKPKLLLMMFVDKKEQSHLSALVTVFSVTKQSGSSSSEQR